MAIDALMFRYPGFFPTILLLLGVLYFNFLLMRKHSHFHWNLFMIAGGLLAIGFLAELLSVLYSYGYAELIMHASTALSAVMFGFTAYVAVKENKK